MKTSHLASVLAAVMLAGTSAVSQAQVALPAYEPFDYTPGTTSVLVTLAPTTWTLTGSNALLTATVELGSLSHAGLPAPVGNKVRLSNGANFEDPGMDITGVTGDGNSLYVSAIVNVVNPGNTSGDYFLHISSAGPTSTDFHSRLFVRQGSSAGLFNLGIQNHTTPGSRQWDSTNYPVGTPVLVVVSYDLVSGTVNDVSRVWVNPSLGLPTPPPATVTSTAVTGDTDLTTVGRVNLRQGSGNTNLLLQVDELRVSTSWTDVTPTNAGVGDWTLY